MCWEEVVICVGRRLLYADKPKYRKACAFKKFHTKQRELDATEDVQNSSNLGISSYDKKFLTVAWNSFL